MLRLFLTKAHPRIGSRVIFAVSEAATKADISVLDDVAKRARISKVCFWKSSLLAAIGTGLATAEPYGSMIVGIGAGTTYVALISNSTIAYSRWVRIGGDHMNEAIINYLRRKYNLLIGERRAEQLK